MVRRSRAVLCAVALVVGAVAVPVLVRPADAAVEAPAARDGLIAFSVGVQVPPLDEDLRRASDIWTVRPDGSGLRRLTHVPDGVTAALPAWSPRGGSIVFQTNPNGDHELWAMGAHGAGKHRIAGAPRLRLRHAELVARRPQDRLQSMRQAVRLRPVRAPSRP